MRWSWTLPVRCLLGALLVGAAAGAHGDAPWRFAIDHGVERSTRSYLIVVDARQPTQRAVRVRSDCRKPVETEGAYGRCTHTLTLDGRTLQLDTGEDVAAVEAKWGAALVLATLEYGCCGGPWTARFYDSHGRYLGLTQGLGSTAIGDNAITRRHDFHNRTMTRTGADLVLLLGDDPAHRLDGLRVLTLGTSGAAARPLQLDAGELGSCDDWYVAGFDAFADREDIVLALAGGPCSAEPSQRRYACEEHSDRFSCKPIGPNSIGPK